MVAAVVVVGLSVVVVVVGWLSGSGGVVLPCAAAIKHRHTAYTSIVTEIVVIKKKIKSFWQHCIIPAKL